MAARVPLEVMEQIAQGVDHAEGICLTLDGTVYLSGERGQIYRLERDDSATEVISTGGWTLGLTADAEGRVYACDPVHHAVMRWVPGSDEVTAWSTGVPGRPFRNANWGAFAPDGTYYVSDSGAWKSRDGCIVAVRRGQTTLWTGESRDFPNGLAVSPDGRELWVLESTPGRLVSYDIGRDGRAGACRVVLDLPFTVPDGIAFADDGSVLIAGRRCDRRVSADSRRPTGGHESC